MGLMERLKLRKMLTKAVIYARFSSDNQRDASIDAQVRAIKEFAKGNNIIIVENYIDRAKSATTDDRPAFQRMIEDSAKHNFEIVLVHKLDRFARNRTDSMVYRSKLRKNGVSLLSVTEPLDDERPEAIILESVLEGMAEYYSKNLAREVRKGLKENALQAKHTGGRPPLGYDVDRVTRKLVINEDEAAAVRLIFMMTLQGAGYHAILHELNARGYQTKMGKPFGKNSLYEILRNKKYTGIYIYNRVVEKDPDTHKRNNHRERDASETIILPDAVPRIISDEDFQAVQAILNRRRRHREVGRGKKETYLLTGKIVCGECGCAYSGNRKKSSGNRKPIITYRCNNRARRTKQACHNREVNRDYLENFVLDQIERAVFNKDVVSHLVDEFKDYLRSLDTEQNASLKRLQKQVAEVEQKEEHLLNLLASGKVSEAQELILLESMEHMDADKRKLQGEIERVRIAMDVAVPSREEIERYFQKARKQFRDRTLKEQQELVNEFVEKIIVHEDEVEVILNLVSFVYRRTFTRETQKVTRRQLQARYHA